MKRYNSANVTVPRGLIQRGGGLGLVTLTVRYGLIDRGRDGLCLVDTGFTPAVTQGNRSLALRIYNSILRPQLLADHAAASVIASLGAKAADVAMIIATHLHADHVSGLALWPKAQIVSCGVSVRAALEMNTVSALHNGIFKEFIPADIKSRLLAFQTLPLRDTGTVLGPGYDLFGDNSYLAIALPGHASGHMGVFWRTDAGPVLYATDAAWTLTTLIDDKTPWLASSIVYHDRTAARETEIKLRLFKQNGGTLHLCHDIETVSL